MNEIVKRQIRTVETWPRRAGKQELLKILRGEPVGRTGAIKAHCYKCNCGDGGPCTAITCALYKFSQYARQDEQEGSKNKS